MPRIKQASSRNFRPRSNFWRMVNSFKFRRFDKKSNEPATTLKSYLASVGSPSPTMLPKPLEGVPSLGCYTLDFEGIKMSMICLEDQLMHLTNSYKNDCRDEFPEGTSIYESVKHDQSFKVWRQGDHIYILSIHGERSYKD